MGYMRVTIPTSPISFHEGDVYNALCSLDPMKAGGIDEISSRVLKYCSLGLCYPLHHLYSVSLATGCIPQEWRTHLITPIYKSGNRSDVQNYRPISLLPKVSKVIERIIYNRIEPHISQQLHHCQFGFSKGKSCLQQLLIFLHQLVNNNSQSDTLYLDFSKAFDCVSHDS